MKWSGVLDVIKPLAGVAASFIPGGPAVVAAVNAFLPEDEKLTEASTGAEIVSKVEALPPESRASFMEKEIDLKIAQEEGWTDRYKAMCSSDGQSTRPQIAMMMAKILCFAIAAFSVLLAWGISTETDMSDWWPVFTVLTGTPAAVLQKYFGELRKEQANRLGVKDEGLFGKLGQMFGK